MALMAERRAGFLAMESGTSEGEGPEFRARLFLLTTRRRGLGGGAAAASSTRAGAAAASVRPWSPISMLASRYSPWDFLVRVCLLCGWMDDGIDTERRK